MKPYVLVTGAAGFIASHLVERLLERGTPVLGVDCFDPFYPRSVKESNLSALRKAADESRAPFVFLEKDVNDCADGALDGYAVESVVHLAAKAGVRPSILDPIGYLHANVSGTLALLEYCRKAGVRRFVFGSSSSVYGNSTPVPFREDAIADHPISPYAASKRAAELYCANYAHLYGLRIASLRFFTVYGPRQRPDLAIHKFAQLMNEGRPIVLYGDGRSSRDYTYVSDIVTGITSALTWLESAPEGTYDTFNLGGSATTPLIGLVRLLESSLGMKASLLREPAQPGDVERTFAEISKSQRALGYQPTVPIAEGIRLFAEWFLNERSSRLAAPLGRATARSA
jgi:UDP-glucuronate 4-epimerase